MIREILFWWLLTTLFAFVAVTLIRQWWQWRKDK